MAGESSLACSLLLYMNFHKCYADLGNSSFGACRQGSLELEQHPHCIRLAVAVHQVGYLGDDSPLDIRWNDILYVLLA